MFALDSNQVVLMVLLDLSAAFDTIDHQIFVSRLFKRIGVRSTVLSSCLDGLPKLTFPANCQIPQS